MRSAQHLAWLLLMVGGAAAVVGILGPSERWGGVDIRATGDALFMLSLVAGVVLFATRGEQVFGIQDLFANRFMQKLITPVIAWSLIAHLIGSRAAGIESDERDWRLRHRADRAGDWAFTLIVITGLCVLALIQAPLHAWWLSPMVLANLLIGLLIAKSLVEHVALAFADRAGHA